MSADRRSTRRLAIEGGRPVGNATVPSWPQLAPRALAAVAAVLESGRWSLPGVRRGGPSAEECFARRFGQFLGAPHCVPVNNGSAALVIALEALDVGAGDEVIIPALTWVANATSVLAVNATPVMADIDPATLCISATAIEAAITERTRAIVVVHLFSSVADLDAITAIGKSLGIPVIEDCSHAHGASWRGRRAGTWGAVGTFSMQEQKLLTSGEGGAAVCQNPELYDRLYQLRSDGRRPRAHTVDGESDLLFDGSVSGTNYCMAQVCAALLDAQLDLLSEQNDRRAKRAAVLDEVISAVPGATPVSALDGVTERTYYRYALRIDPDGFDGVSAATLCRALHAETGLPWQPAYPPLYRHPLYRPRTKRRFTGGGPSQRPAPDAYPEAERAHREIMTLQHPALLAGPDAFDVLPAAFGKLRRHMARLRLIDRTGDA
ncbi:3-amino-5-hydroxybenzoate synthase [Nonomuraea monospora]|uniref:3-amino-5-hydroxybenzoate synthase n=1 Tax=Nonomuraea monospora TaxID=568818 RepID=A0ABN3C6Q5_9ACTN